jgi:hypothetical protein
VYRIRRSDPGCRGEDLIQNWSSPARLGREGLEVEDRPAASHRHTPPPATAQVQAPIAWDDGSTLAIAATADGRSRNAHR